MNYSTTATPTGTSQAVGFLPPALETGKRLDLVWLINQLNEFPKEMRKQENMNKLFGCDVVLKGDVRVKPLDKTPITSVKKKDAIDMQSGSQELVECISRVIDPVLAEISMFDPNSPTGDQFGILLMTGDKPNEGRSETVRMYSELVIDNMKDLNDKEHEGRGPIVPSESLYTTSAFAIKLSGGVRATSLNPAHQKWGDKVRNNVFLGAYRNAARVEKSEGESSADFQRTALHIESHAKAVENILESIRLEDRAPGGGGVLLDRCIVLPFARPVGIDLEREGSAPRGDIRGGAIIIFGGPPRKRKSDRATKPWLEENASPDEILRDPQLRVITQELAMAVAGLNRAQSVRLAGKQHSMRLGQRAFAHSTVNLIQTLRSNLEHQLSEKLPIKIRAQLTVLLGSVAVYRSRPLPPTQMQSDLAVLDAQQVLRIWLEVSAFIALMRMRDNYDPRLILQADSLDVGEQPYLAVLERLSLTDTPRVPPGAARLIATDCFGIMFVRATWQTFYHALRDAFQKGEAGTSSVSIDLAAKRTGEDSKGRDDLLSVSIKNKGNAPEQDGAVSKDVEELAKYQQKFATTGKVNGPSFDPGSKLWKTYFEVAIPEDLRRRPTESDQ